MGLLGQDFVSRITGSAFADTAANTIVAPEGQAIIGIQVIGDETNVVVLDSLVAVDATRDFNTVSAAGSTGRFTRTVDGEVSSAAKVIFDQENDANDGGIKPGDKIYTDAGVLLATVLALNPDGDNTKEISTVAAFSASDGATLTFTRPGGFDNVGAGGQAFANTNKLLSGTTIYGTWSSVSLNTNDTDGGIIVYFAQI
jgi:hypothetical protein|tara:strand:- start:655 stop:1251 length:597 start_codon:yes stop_codon:yes gene_type:complete